VRIQIFSDLHAGVAPLKRITVAKDVDVVVAAGDIAEGAENAFVTLRGIVPEAVPIIFTMGNHEYYRRFLGEELALARAIAPGRNVFLLENDTIVISGVVRFAGASLWTDYRMFGDVLADYLERIAAGAEPTAAELANAPLLVNWRCILSPVGLRLLGHMTGHPRLGDTEAMTSHLWSAGGDGRWIRTLSRYYRLGIQADAHLLDVPYEDEVSDLFAGGRHE
jgi:hypothetical protein